MSKKFAKNTLNAAIGAAFVAGMAAAPIANASDNPFAVQALSAGYQLAAAGTEGNCGANKAKQAPEGNCGANKAKAEAEAKKKAAEGNCGANKAKAEAKKKAAEGNCGASMGM